MIRGAGAGNFSAFGAEIFGRVNGRTPNCVLRPSDLLDMSPDDAREGGVGDGDQVRVVSRHGFAVLPVRVNVGIARGQLFATFHTPDILVNALTSGHRDSAVGTPEYKLTAVRVERLTTPSGDGGAA